MSAEEIVLIDESKTFEEIVLNDGENDGIPPDSTISENSGGSIRKKDSSSTGLIIALIGLVLLVALFVYKNMKENE